MIRWLALGLVLTLVLGVATYSYQDAEASNLNPIKGYVSAGGTTVAIEIENGTTTTTTPETKPAPEPEECEQGDNTDYCKELKELKERQERELKELEERERYEEGQETAKNVADTVKEKITETVKGTGEEIKEGVDNVADSSGEYVWQYAEKSLNNVTGFDLAGKIADCRNTSCMLKARQEAKIWEWNQTQNAIQDNGGLVVTVTKSVDPNELKPCDDTACLLKRKHQAELDEFYKNEEKNPTVVVLNEDGLKPCDNTACLLKRIHQAELDEFYGVTKKSSFLANYNFTQQIIVINLSSGCEKALMQNVTTICPTYEDLMQFNNINQKISGEFVYDENGFYHRGQSDYKQHCNYYLPEMLPVVIAVDGGDCWIKERGAMSITVNAISTENFKFKINDSYDIDRLRSIQQQDTRILNDESEYQKNVDRLEDLLELRDDGFEEMEERLEDFDEITRTLFEDVGENPDTKKIRADERQQIIDSYSNRSLDRQDRAWEKELREAQADLDEVLAEKNELRAEQLAIKIKTSGVTTNSTITFGIGRSIDQCREAQVGSDIQMIADTINFLLKNCDEREKRFDSKLIIELEQTPINYLEHQSYNYTKWLAEAKEVCKTICKEY